MGDAPLRLVVLTQGNAERLLLRLLRVPRAVVVGVFVETATARRRPLVERLRRSLRYDGWAATVLKFGRLAGAPFSPAPGSDGQGPLDSLLPVARAADVPLEVAGDLHSDEARTAIRKAMPDLGIVWGTNILKESVFGLPRLGSVNLHQGLAPWYRGGPSVFWELFNGEREVGLTVHWVSAQVDAGDILLQETIPLEYPFETYGAAFEPFLSEYRAGLRERGTELMAEAVERIASGTAERRVQDVTLGRRYRLPTKAEKDELRRRLAARFAGTSASLAAKRPGYR